MAEKPAIDWDAIEREYRAGQISVRAIATEHGISETAIRKRAAKHGWERALADRVREAVREKLVRSDSGSQSGSQAPRVDDAEIVEQSSLVGLEVVLSHRRDISQLRGIASIIASRLAAHLNGEPVDGGFMSDKESVGDLLEKLTRVRSKLIPLERQAFNLDADGLSDEPATKRDVASAVRRLNQDQREQLRSIASAIAGEPGNRSAGT